MNQSLPRSKFDTPWKNILDKYFEDFIAFCWPRLYREIDWEKGCKMLDKELNKIARNMPATNCIVDKLVEIYLKNEEDIQVLFHVEVQGRKTLNFEERMFIYRCRLRDCYRKPVVSLAILIDGNKHWRSGVYREELWGSSIEMHFPIIKLLDYKDRIPELKASKNRFAAVILAQLTALESKSIDAKLVSKISLIKWLYHHGWQKEDVVTLLLFIDWVFALPEDLEVKCQKVIGELEEELRVAYVSSFERIGMQRGMEKGMQQGMQQGIQKGIQKGESALLLRLLQHKFKSLPDLYRARVEQANAETLLTWGERVLDSQNLEEVFEV